MRIRLFGGLELARDDVPCPPFPTQKARNLFAFLVVHRARLHARESLAGIFFGELPDGVARKNLRTELWRIRGVVDERHPVSPPVLRAHADEVGLNTGAEYWLDLHEFERRIVAARTRGGTGIDAARAGLLEEAVALYRGDLLSGFYERWCDEPRNRLQQMYLTALEDLVRYHRGRGDLDAAIRFGRRLVRADPLAEHATRNLMRDLYHYGDRPAALRQYAAFETFLWNELEVEPMPETRKLEDEIRSGSETLPSPPPEAGPRDGDESRLRLGLGAGTETAVSGILERAEALLAQLETVLSDVRVVADELGSTSQRLRRELRSPPSGGTPPPDPIWRRATDTPG